MTSYRARLAETHLKTVLQAQPVVVLMGARQTGKSTLVRHAAELQGHTYLTLDSLDVRTQALGDPEGLVARAPSLVIDEVQRAADVVIAVKAAVDAEPRRPGRFVLTGSANLLGLKHVKETLAGRAAYVTLWPLTRRESLGLGTAGCWSQLVESDVADWTSILEAQSVPAADWHATARQSRYPPVAVGELTPGQQSDWLQGYIEAVASKDIAEISQMSNQPDGSSSSLPTCSIDAARRTRNSTTW